MMQARCTLHAARVTATEAGNNCFRLLSSSIDRNVLRKKRTKQMKPALSGRRGGNLRADCIKNLASRFLDVLKAGRQELRVTLVELNVVLRR